MRIKVLPFKWFLPAIAVLLLFPGLSFAKKEYTKTIRKEFMTQADGVVELSNRHGDIEITTWNENRVSIKVIITVDACSEEDAQSVFDRIVVDFENNRNYVGAETRIEKKSKSWWKGLRGCEESYAIDYLVSMPASNNLIIENKYGDIYIDELKREAEVVLGYGNLRMEGVAQRLQLDFSYGNGFIVNGGQELNAQIHYSKTKITEAGTAKIESKYSTVELLSCEQLECETKYDRYFVGESKQITNTGKYDNFQIREVETLHIETEYTDVKVDDLYKAMNANLKYGGVKVSTLHPGFSELELEGKFTNYKLGVASDADYQLEADARYAGVDFPSAMQVTFDEREGNSKRIRGASSGGNSSGVIRAHLDYGSLKVYQK